MQFRIPSWLSWYKKPEYRDIREYATHVSSGRRSLSPEGRNGGIPHRLRLDRILANKTCSPMSLYDFYMYLKHIEYSAENLEFYVWFKNYEAAYHQKQAAGAKEYGSMPSGTESTSSVAQIKPAEKHDEDDDDDDVDNDNDQEAAHETLNRISQLISTTAMCAPSGTCPGSTTTTTTTRGNSPAAPSLSPSPADPTSPLPPDTDLSTIIALFLLPSSPKELNIPSSLRTQALTALQRAPHGPPSALQPVAEHVYSLLRNCSHRNFVRLGVGNGTFETVCVATLLGAACLVAGFALAVCRATVPSVGAHSRWEAWAAWPLWGVGMSLVLSGVRGSCFFLLLFSRRQRLPWERLEEGDGEGERERPGEGREGSKGGLSQNRRIGGSGGGGGGGKGVKGVWRTVRRLMIFDRRIRVQERHLRRLQRRIVLQSLAGGCAFATLCVALFIWLPVWRETV